MSRKKLFWMAFLALVLVVPAAHAASPGSWVVSANGGLSLPTGDFGGDGVDQLDASTGYQFGGAVDYVLNEMFAVGVDGSWNSNKHGGEGDVIDLGGGDTYTLDEAKFSTWQIGAHGKYMIPSGAGPISPFLLAGVGVYNTKLKWEETFVLSGVSFSDSGEETSDTRFGFKGGAGASFRANDQVSVGIEGDYNFISEDKDKVGVDNLQYIGVHAFVAWAIMPK